ncbi:uncharacterized protein B0P05DRAFT_537128 [Gilbertella persicaria]|uniref:Uncharacterized protein n=1 Tax=Rhizopus stolonifer TaxID=4846 RepID=A0A367J1G3_RHIST|nr:uncharacterized protein B0P05DRAFT_537128 [Gilbertella persicaria]KAI8083395.1 hypothetical protein B0P05DRAFT_537128 [Gilbertella persicaria]RCH83777.1 hypothetical protein CU098_006281 [Rhizopus stolonifer]
MHLFEEKNKYAPLPVGSPLPIKANGAIVVHRPSDLCSSNLSSLPLYLQDIDDDKQSIKQDEGVVIEQAKEDTESEHIVPPFEDIEIIDLVHEENNRLRQQIFVEREQNEKWRLAKERSDQELTCSEQKIKSLKRTLDRFERLLLSSENKDYQRSRRQSTGTVSYTNHHSAASDSGSAIESYERKLQILLSEIEAMEQGELELVKKLAEQSNENDKLQRKINYRDDIIRQLACDLQIERHVARHK